jgi:ADP-heptose:LPS heptosyltransferase
VSERLDRILLVKLGDLGDLILTTPALRALREARPGATIDLLAPPTAAPIVGGTGLVDAHLRLPRAALEAAVRRGPLGLPTLAAFAAALRRRRYDAVVLLQHLTTAAGTARYAGLLAASGARRRFGLDNGRGLFLTDRVPDAGFGARHEAAYWLEVVARLGADRRPRPTELPASPADHDRAAGLLTGLPRPIVALHAGSGPYSTARRWAPDRFAAVGRALAARRRASLVVVGTEAALNRQLSAATGGRDLTGQTSVPELAALLGRVDLLVCNDGGVMHVGVAANAPVVAIFGLTDPRVWGPWYGDPARQPRAEVVDVPLPCRPCFYRGHRLGWRDGCATRDCLALVSAGMVVAAAERQLDRWGPAIAGG